MFFDRFIVAVEAAFRKCNVRTQIKSEFDPEHKHIRKIVKKLIEK